MKTEQHNAREAAIAKAVEDLFTDGLDRKARRLVMEFDEQLNGLTGWSKVPIADKLRDFATKVASQAVAAERLAIAKELDAILSAKVDRGDWLENIWKYIEWLKGSLDDFEYGAFMYSQCGKCGECPYCLSVREKIREIRAEHKAKLEGE